MQELSDYTHIIEDRLKQLYVPEEPKDLYEPIRYILQLGGKRIRPALTLMTANLYGQKIDEAMPAALALEVFHNFTLLHDDLMDKALIRRGKPTVHTCWNDNIAILSGDAALILAYQFLEQLSDSVFKNTFRVFNQTAIEVCEGQQFDMDFENRMDVSVAEYLEMIRLKTSVLIAASMKIGAICAEASLPDQNLLYEIGENLGLAFQLQDDYLDVFSNSDTFGKENGGDILNNKKTYLLINALNSDNTKLVNELKVWLEKKEYNPEDKIAAVKDIYKQLETGEETQLQAISFINNAIELLNQLEVPSENKKPIENIIFKLMYREK
jgi:geranylgeranyl diphosphate synthase type II